MADMNEQLREERAQQALSAARDALARAAGGSAGSPAARQAHADELCRWLRRVWGLTSDLAPVPAELGDVAHDIARFLGSRLRYEPGVEGSFAGLDLDLSGTALEVDFSRARFTAGTVDFRGCRFGSGFSFERAVFGGARVLFDGSTFFGTRQRGSAQFAGAVFQESDVSFREAAFHRGTSCFDDTCFPSGRVDLTGIRLADSVLSFVRADFSGAEVIFSQALLESGSARFPDCHVSGGIVTFDRATIRIPVSFDRAVVDGGELGFIAAESSSPDLSFSAAKVTRGKLTMQELLVSGGKVTFDGLIVDGGELVLDGVILRFGNLNLGTASFLSGTASLGIEVEFDSVLEMPWGRYGSAVASVKDPTFDGSDDHDFMTKVAAYRPNVITNWGRFRPPANSPNGYRG
jgi:hypothetical protein